MNWFSGLLVIPLGEQTGYVHLSYTSRYENYLLIRIKDGVVVESEEMDLDAYMDFKSRQFEEFKSTPEYKALYKELSEGSEPGEDFDLEGFIFQMGEFTHKIDIPFKSHDKPKNSAVVSSND
ncbi:hypothetical protein [Thalassotalea fusca]